MKLCCKTALPHCVSWGVKLIALLLLAPMAAFLPLHAETPPAPKPPVSAAADGVFHLLPGDATLAGEAIQLEKSDDATHIGHWRQAGDTASWTLRVPQDGRYLVRIETACPMDGAVLLIECAGKLALRVPNSGSLQSYESSRVGELTLSRNEALVLTLRPVVDGWQQTNVRKVELLPLP